MTFSRTGIVRLAGLAVLGLVTGLAGCAQTATPGATGTPGPSHGSLQPVPVVPSVSPSASPTSGGSDVVDASGCHTNLRVDESNSGKTFCVVRDGLVTVTLRAPAGHPWKPIALTGDALGPATGVSPPPGTVVATYTARTSGTATLSSSRSVCPSPPAPGTVSCMALQGFQVTIRVP